ncbi:MAG: hypothetical protein ACREHC_05675 [Candidatus Levyibacteriota bacterium]
MMSPLEEKKKKLEESIVEIMIQAVENKTINEDDMADISSYVLETIDAISDKESFKAYIHDLASQWVIFKPIEIMEEAELKEKIEDEVAQGVLVLLEHGKIDNAIKLAQSVTHAQNSTQSQ